VATTTTAHNTVVFLYNPGASSITVGWQTSAGSQPSFTVAAGASARKVVPVESGARFYSTGSQRFQPAPPPLPEDLPLALWDHQEEAAALAPPSRRTSSSSSRVIRSQPSRSLPSPAKQRGRPIRRRTLRQAGSQLPGGNASSGPSR
jgi:hypothetical protein